MKNCHSRAFEMLSCLRLSCHFKKNSYRLNFGARWHDVELARCKMDARCLESVTTWGEMLSAYFKFNMHFRMHIKPLLQVLNGTFIIHHTILMVVVVVNILCQTACSRVKMAILYEQVDDAK
jgi:hypothetical protein